MGRNNNGQRRGPPSWTTATQFQFLMDHSQVWVDTNSKAHGHFYDNVTWLFIKHFGWGLDNSESPEPLDSEIDSIRASIAAETAECTITIQLECQTIYANIRKVRHTLYCLFFCFSPLEPASLGLVSLPLPKAKKAS